MPDPSQVLHNGQHEHFCRQMVTHGNASKAAREAGYAEKGARAVAYKLRRRPEIAARIAYLKDAVSDRWMDNTAGVRDNVLKSLIERRKVADQKGDLSSGNKADELIGKSVGLFVSVERKEDPLGGMTPAELRQFMAGMLEDPVIRRVVVSILEESGQVVPRAVN